MRKLYWLIPLLMVLLSCSNDDLIEGNGEIIISNNSQTNVHIEIVEFGMFLVGDSLAVDEVMRYEFSRGAKKVVIYGKDGSTIVKDIVIASDESNRISVISKRSVTILNNRELPIKFHYQRCLFNQLPEQELWETFQINNQAVLIEAGKSAEVVLVEGYKYWGSFTNDDNTSIGKNKVRFRVNQDLSTVIL